MTAIRYSDKQKLEAVAWASDNLRLGFYAGVPLEDYGFPYRRGDYVSMFKRCEACAQHKRASLNRSRVMTEKRILDRLTMIDELKKKEKYQ